MLRKVLRHVMLAACCLPLDFCTAFHQAPVPLRPPWRSPPYPTLLLAPQEAFEEALRAGAFRNPKKGLADTLVNRINSVKPPHRAIADLKTAAQGSLAAQPRADAAAGAAPASGYAGGQGSRSQASLGGDRYPRRSRSRSRSRGRSPGRSRARSRSRSHERRDGAAQDTRVRRLALPHLTSVIAARCQWHSPQALPPSTPGMIDQSHVLAGGILMRAARKLPQRGCSQTQP